jgi:hypothetical protein
VRVVYPDGLSMAAEWQREPPQRPIAVSSDGDVTVYFQSRNGGQPCEAVLNYL